MGFYLDGDSVPAFLSPGAMDVVTAMAPAC